MKLLKKGTALLLSFAIVLGLVGSGFLIHTIAETAHQWNRADYDDLSRYYEVGDASDGPGYVSSVDGDPGGKSYGMYMFASASNTPYKFAQWCVNSDNPWYNQFGSDLVEAYTYPISGYGTNFDNVWRWVYEEYRGTFAQAQFDYTQATFYTPLVDAVERNTAGFDIENYSVALKNVFWSRAVQHGVDGAYSLIQRAFAALGGFANQPESEIIQAIYNESGRLVSAAELRAENGKSGETMSGTTADKYGTTGKILRYYYGCSGDVQMGVYTRLRVREPADALVMLMNNRTAHQADGSYHILLSGDQRMSLSADDRGNVDVHSAASARTFTLTYFEGGFYTLSAVVNNKTLRLSAGRSGVSMETPSTSDSQKWELVGSASGSGQLLKNVATGTYLSYQESSLVMVSGTDGVVAAWQPVPVADSSADFSLQGVIYPGENNTLAYGASSFPVRGVVACSVPIDRISISVTTRAGRTTISASARPNDTAYDLMNLDDSVAYSNLSEGSYTFTLTAEAGGKSFTLVESSFTVGRSSGPIRTEDTYTVTFDANGGTLQGSATKTVSLDDIVYGKLPSARKKGYSFIGWFTDPVGGEQIMSGNKVIAADLTLYAHYADTYTYTFLDADGDTYMVGTVAEGELIPAPRTAPAKAPDGKNAYRFSHWDGYTEGKTVMESKNMTFSPVYTAIPLGQTTDGDYWPGLTPGATASQLGRNVTVYDGDLVVSDDTPLATGMTAQVGGQTYILVVKGDLNGDGKITIIDLVSLQSHLVGKTSLTGAYKEAADLNDDGAISITDVVKAARVIVGKDTVS